MPIFVIDTNIFLRVLVSEDQKSHQECVHLLTKIKENKVDAVVTGISLAEVAWTLLSYYELPKAEVVAALKSILSLNNLKVVDDYDYRFAVEVFSRLPVKYIDCCIASLPKVQTKEWGIVSYDKDFRSLPVMWLKPVEVK